MVIRLQTELTALFLALITAALAAPTPGTYELSDPSLATRMDAALETTLADMNFAIRLVAKPGLEAVLEACQVYTVSFAGDNVVVQCDQRPTIIAPLDGTPTPSTGSNGKTYTVSATASGDDILLNFSGENGSQTTRYAFGTDALTVTREIVSEHLKTPLRCDYRYVRATPPSAGAGD